MNPSMSTAHWAIYRNPNERRCEWCRHAEGSPLYHAWVRCYLNPERVMLMARVAECDAYERAPGADDNRGGGNGG